MQLDELEATIVGAILFELRMSPAFRVRGYRMAVRITSDSVYVHGYFLTRRVERAAITAVTNDPAIEWVDAAGRTRRTPVRVFDTAPGSFGAVDAYNRGMVARIERTRLAFDGKSPNRRRSRRRSR
jgi:hypothetical protein